ncbi:erythromycin esterase family protein [Halomarina oriensis]|uniref:Succinoglycan biosynthesis n=1 Tax=Halomarina oriensis TaxID=671145 RepID=A0A6B0GNZ1_9EURY|nr:erythromycin esterase family protein [Halomarina oriensis]MWG35239.1 succinoglycan biosynthesis [Halomarina oriensis]
MTHDTTDDASNSTDRTETENLADRLRCSITELVTTDPTADHADLHPVGDALADARIVGLGEATHGTREFFQLKHRIVRSLVEEQGLRLFAMEANLPETTALNDYVVYGEGDPAAALDGTHFWTWTTEAVLALVEWLREFNEGRPLDSRVRFHGIDAQYTTGAVEYLDEFLAVADPDLREEVGDDLAATDDSGNITDQYTSDHAPEATERLLDRLETAFEERSETFVSATSARETAMARRCLRVVEQTRERRVARETDGMEAAMLVRDEAMAENLAWALDHTGRDRAALWAHDAHVCRTENIGARVDPAPSLGSHLAERYGDDYYALGFDFLGGPFRAIGIELTPESELSTWSLDEPPADSVTRLFAATGSRFAFLDFDAMGGDERLAEWFAEPRAKRELGAVYYGSDGPSESEDDGQDAHNAVRVLPDAFDGILFVRETTPSRGLSDSDD